jgi:transcriptional regulator GlxA family with amidase domain
VGIGVRPLRDVDVLVVPGFDASPGQDVDQRLGDLRPEVEAVRRQVAAGRPVVSVCVGAFLLGAAGALDGRRATTSWLFAGDLAARHPATEVESDHLVVTDRGVTTTAAFSAMHDFVLDLLTRHHGGAVARSTARFALLDGTRTSQAPYVDQRLLPPPGAGFAEEVQRHLERNLAAAYDHAALAAHFHLSTRTLLRHYKDATGESPLAHLHRVRVRRAQHLLESTGSSIADVRRAVGYADSGAFTKLFERHVGLRPAEYRARFARRGEAQPTTAPRI